MKVPVNIKLSPIEKAECSSPPVLIDFNILVQNADSDSLSSVDTLI